MDINAPCISSTVDEHGPINVYQTRTSLILSFDGKIYQSYMKLKDINGNTIEDDFDYISPLLDIKYKRKPKSS